MFKWTLDVAVMGIIIVLLVFQDAFFGEDAPKWARMVGWLLGAFCVLYMLIAWSIRGFILLRG